MLGNSTLASLPCSLFYAITPRLAFTNDDSCRILVNDHLFGDVNYRFHNKVDTRSYHQRGGGSYHQLTSFWNCSDLVKREIRFGFFFFLKLQPGSSVCINKQRSVDLSIYTHGGPGSVLRGFKYLAVAATALNGREMHQTSDLAPALNQKGIPRQSSSLGVRACGSPCPPVVRTNSWSNRNISQIAWFWLSGADCHPISCCCARMWLCTLILVFF